MVVASISLAVAIEFLHELNQKRLMDADGMPSAPDLTGALG
jgi:hypothetical protein